MTTSTKTELKKRALAAVREYGVNLTYFRNAMSEWAGLNLTDTECLRLLFLNGVSTPSAIARHTGLTSGATTAMLDRLEKAALIERRPNPDDRRGTLIAAKERAGQKMASWFESARTAQEALISSYSEPELALIADVFERFARLWNEEREKLQRATDNPTVRQSDGLTVRQSDNPTVRQSDSPTVRQSDSPTVRRSDSPMIRRSDGPIRVDK